MFHLTNILSGLTLAALAAAIPLGNEIFERDGGPCEKSTITNTIVVGDGDPNQYFAYKQATPITDCSDNPGGSATASKSQTVSYSLSISSDLDFITGGFDVSVATTTGYSNTFSCATVGGGSQTGSLCVFQRVQFTAFTVNSITCDLNSCEDEVCTNDTGPNTVIFAPNSDQTPCFYDNFQLAAMGISVSCGDVGSQSSYTYSGVAGPPQAIGC